MLKYAVASVVLILGFAGSAPLALGAPGSDDCVNCAPPKPYDSEAPARIRQEMDRPRRQHHSAGGRTRAQMPIALPTRPRADCTDCPPPKRYDSTEVVKTSHDVDQSRVINTEDVVQVRPRVREINKLVIHENETRNVGVIQHNHRIVEKETRYVKRAPVYRRAVPAYRVPRVQTVFVPVVMQPVQNCGCPCTCSGSHSAYAQAYVYGAGYAYGAGTRPVQQVLVPVTCLPDMAIDRAPSRGAEAGDAFDKAAESECSSGFAVGGARRDRTADLLIANEALSQLSYGPNRGRTQCGARHRVGAIYGAGWGESRIGRCKAGLAACLAGIDPLVSPHSAKANARHALDSLRHPSRS